ncbi:MAG: GNAT family N-acetyltransferase, partial [Methanomassiliicoccales archaeon]|nr:GNAT family N-acetyltransferase [Methanomassiliicoccales archaeon]
SRLLRRPSSVPHAAMVVKDEGGRRVGCLVLRVSPDETGRTAWVYLIFVERDRRRQGYGRRMLAWAEEWGRANGAGHLMLNVRASNEVAMHLYESSGMSPYQMWMRKGL